MARRVAESTLNASTIDILNVIRQNATMEYQNLVPEVQTEVDIPRVGEVLYGHPALANQWLNALINRIAAVRVRSTVFNNPYSALKKGYLEFGETIEEVYVNITKAREFSAEKAYQRELKRSAADVRSAFHVMNYRVQYPVTIQNEDLRMAFTSVNGVTDLIAKIVDAVYTAAEYDEYLLFKYMIIKAVSHGKMKPVPVDFTAIDNAAVAFRGISNMLTFVKTDYNEAGVHTATPKDKQYIFMDAKFNAEYDVGVLSAAFNMDKADFMGRLHLIDDFTTFDNDRFSVIRANSDMIEEVTEGELRLMQDVKAVIVDEEWFQVYDNTNIFTETYVSSGMYWNYNYNVWKTISFSPFANAVAFVNSTADTALPATVTVEITDKSESEVATVLTVNADFESITLHDTVASFVQTEALTRAGIAVQKYGAYIIPATATSDTILAELKIGNTTYRATDSTFNRNSAVGATITLNKV